ncbi:hypothetical protein ABU614_07140 [Lysobacter firmicutimachus]|uniref:DUF2306 domain-containing protein n=1 Tax=Lysobacter firmicutimachus TaxID=1792846 RepID=A0AAU8MXV7_9GAMM
MLGITPFGAFHTALALLALIAGVACLLRHGRIALAWRSGRGYVWLTVAACVTGLFIFHHGGFGPPHALSLLTLAALVAAAGAERYRWFGRAAAYVSTLTYSLTFFFHFIPGFTETLTRLPAGRPWASGPEDPKLAAIIGLCFLIYLIGAAWQVIALRRQAKHSNAAGHEASGRAIQ